MSKSYSNQYIHPNLLSIHTIALPYKNTNILSNPNTETYGH
jgi:hypothetical protein